MAGVLGEAHLAIAGAEAQGKQAVADARSQAISAIMGDLSPVLAQPEYSGDVETALVHFMGERAFTDDASTEKYTSLAERIESQPDKNVPVMFIFRDRDDDTELPLAPDTAMAHVPRSKGVKFVSRITREEGVRVGMSGSRVKDKETGEDHWEFTTTGVTHSVFALQGARTIFDGDPLNGAIRLREPVVTDELALQERHIADGTYGKGQPSAYSISDYVIDRLDDEPTILVGWEEIEDALMKKFRKSSDDMLGEARKIQLLFNTPVSPTFATLQERAPSLAAAIKIAVDFDTAVGKIASKAA